MCRPDFPRFSTGLGRPRGAEADWHNHIGACRSGIIDNKRALSHTTRQGDPGLAMARSPRLREDVGVVEAKLSGLEA